MAHSALTNWLKTREEGAKLNPSVVVEAVPYARMLGVKAIVAGGALTAELPFKPQLIGNPRLPALHGGVIGSFLETAAIVELIYANNGTIMPKTVNLTIEYLRSGKPEDLYATTEITKQGRRVATVRVTAWQSDRTKPVATAHGNFLMDAIEV